MRAVAPTPRVDGKAPIRSKLKSQGNVERGSSSDDEFRTRKKSALELWFVGLKFNYQFCTDVRDRDAKI